MVYVLVEWQSPSASCSMRRWAAKPNATQDLPRSLPLFHYRLFSSSPPILLRSLCALLRCHKSQQLPQTSGCSHSMFWAQSSKTYACVPLADQLAKPAVPTRTRWTSKAWVTAKPLRNVLFQVKVVLFHSMVLEIEHWLWSLFRVTQTLGSIWHSGLLGVFVFDRLSALAQIPHQLHCSSHSVVLRQVLTLQDW